MIAAVPNILFDEELSFPITVEVHRTSFVTRHTFYAEDNAPQPFNQVVIGTERDGALSRFAVNRDERNTEEHAKQKKWEQNTSKSVPGYHTEPVLALSDLDETSMRPELHYSQGQHVPPLSSKTLSSQLTYFVVELTLTTCGSDRI